MLFGRDNTAIAPDKHYKAVIPSRIKKLFTIQHRAFQDPSPNLKDLQSSQNGPLILIMERTEGVVYTLLTSSE